MSVKNIKEYIKKSTINASWIKEFKTIEMLTIHYPASISKSHTDDNRYDNILAYDHTLVSSQPYINANWVNGYLATQAPMEHTIPVFWKTMWDHHITTIVLLTPLIEKNVEKCSLYWPQVEPEMHDEITIKPKTIRQLNADLILRSFTMVVKDQKRVIYQYHFIGWPDFESPRHHQHFIDLIKLVPHQSVAVMCSAGVGRTGTFITIHQLIYEILVDKRDSINIVEFILNLRTQRPKMVQSVDQLKLIYSTIAAIV